MHTKIVRKEEERAKKEFTRKKCAHLHSYSRFDFGSNSPDPIEVSKLSCTFLEDSSAVPIGKLPFEINIYIKKMVTMYSDTQNKE